MTDENELRQLINVAILQGAIVQVVYCVTAKAQEGRLINDTVQVSGLRGCGPFPMKPIAAAERLRACVLPTSEFSRMK